MSSKMKKEYKKSTSCGVIITDGKVILLGHSTGNRHWDIPKGSMDSGETFIDTALRELNEETSIVLTPNDVSDLGHHEYTPRKDLYLFLYKTDNLPLIQDVICTSMCERGNRTFPELDFFKYVPLEKIQGYTTINMNRTLQIIFDGFK